MTVSPAPVLTLTDLASWSFAGTALAVLGHPVAHSLSPPMHNTCLAELSGRDPAFADWHYFRFDVPPETLPSALRLLHVSGFKGLNLTLPHKTLAVPLVEALDPAAQAIGAVNTLLRTPTGWRGFNTDGYGLATGLHETLGLALADRDVLLLGAGGAARSAAVECLQRRCRSLWIANRTASTLHTLLAELRPLAGDIPLHGFDPAAPPEALPADALVINATSLGLHADDALPIDLVALPRPAGVFDMVYNPPLTRLLQQAQELGLPTANGLAMLIHQGARALEIWTEREVSVPALWQGVRSARAGVLA